MFANILNIFDLTLGVHQEYFRVASWTGRNLRALGELRRYGDDVVRVIQSILNWS